ncbi:MAG: RusA family crossover junction endodeoxyribonuclease, partial [Planctomycetaceae bacterium]
PPAPAFPDTTPDLTKLIRGVEDALQSVLLTNDSRVVEQRTRKVWGRREGVLIELFTFPKKMRDVWEATQRSLLP